MGRRVAVGLGLLLLIGLGVTASALTWSRSPRAAADSRDRDVLLLTYSNDPDTLNPLTANDNVSRAFQRQVYEPLAERNFADPDKWDRVLATSWEFDEKALTYLIHLRHGVKWHPIRLPDGRLLPETELTSLDVKFTFDVILNPNVEAASLRSYYEDPEAEDEAHRYKIKVDIVDKYTVKVQWTKPYFLSKDFTLDVNIIPRHVFSVDEHGEPIALNFALKEFADGFNQHWANTKMCGTGPMMYEEWIRDQRLVLVRNPDYWGEPFPFKRVVYRSIPNSNTATQKLLQGDLDFVGIPDKDQFIQEQDHPNVIPGHMVTVRKGNSQWVKFVADSKDSPGFVKMVDFPYPGYRYIGYNLNRPIFKDVAFRRALGHAVPVQKIIDEVFKGLAERTTGPFELGSSAYNDKLQPLAFNLDEARKLLADAGWKDLDHDGVLDKKMGDIVIPARFDLMIYADAPSYRTVGEIIKEECRKIGIDVLVSPTKWALMLEKLNNRAFDAAMLGWGGVWRDDPFQLWHGSLADTPYSSNFISYRNPKVDKLIDKLRVTLDDKAQIPIYHEIHRLIYEDQPYTFLFADKQTGGYNARLEDVRFYRIRPCTDATQWRASRSRMR